MTTQAQARSILAATGWKLDKFGNFKSSKGTVRVKLNPKALRVEREYQPAESFGYKPPKQWLNVTSDYYCNITVVDDRLVIKGRKLAAMNKDETSCV